MFILLLLFAVIHTVHSTCPEHMFLGCVLRLKAQRVPFERNMINVIFNIGTEARLLHTCKVYGSTLPCFREKILECGDDKQRRQLNEVGKMLMFMCSPFSLQRQRLLMSHQKCIFDILSMPATTGCQIHGHYHGKQLQSCRKRCQDNPSNFICLMRTWISEQNVCTMKDIEDKCGEDSAEFYKDMQTTVFEPSFPVLCEFEDEFTTMTTTMPTTTTVPTTTVNAMSRFKKIFKQKKIYGKPQIVQVIEPGLSMNISNTAFPTLATQTPLRTTPAAIMWTKRPTHARKEGDWGALQQKPRVPVIPIVPVIEEIVPIEITTTMPAPTPRSIKVINILKSFLPGKLPAGLESFFQSPDFYKFGANTAVTSQINDAKPVSIRRKATKLPPSTTSTPTTTTTSITTTLSTNMTAPIRATEATLYQAAPSKQPRWKPWYLGGSTEEIPAY